MSISVAARLAALKRVSLFADLEPGELELLAAAALPRHFEPGEMIFSEGEPCEGLYVVEKGEVKLFKVSASGREQVLALEGPGGSIAELPVFDGGNYPASASADKPSDLVFVRKKDLRALCLEHPEVALKVLKVVSGRLRQLVGMVEQLSFSTVHRRLVAYLVKEASAKGKRTSRGVEFDIGMNNQELAAHVGTVRELVSRNLSRLQASKLIKLDGRTVVVLDSEALKAEAQNE